MIVYCDSSVLLKRVLNETDSANFRETLANLINSGAALITSALGQLEISRVLRRHSGEGGMLDTQNVLEDVTILAISDVVLQNAADVPHPYLRSMDAIHVASAFSVRADLVLTRDKQMRAACEELGMLVGP